MIRIDLDMTSIIKKQKDNNIPLGVDPRGKIIVINLIGMRINLHGNNFHID